MHANNHVVAKLLKKSVLQQGFVTVHLSEVRNETFHLIGAKHHVEEFRFNSREH